MRLAPFRKVVDLFLMSIKSAPIHVMDFEGNTRSGIIEYGIVTIHDGAVVDTQSRFCQPRAPIDPIDSRLHGIRNQDTEGARPVEDEWLLFSGCRRTGPLCAHHAQVEDGLLRQVWPYPGHVPDLLHTEGQVETWAPWIDTRILYAYLFPDLDSHQLMDLVKTFHLESPLKALVERYCPPGRQRHHCALHDALASAVLLLQIPELPGYQHVDTWWYVFNSAKNQSQRDAWMQGELGF